MATEASRLSMATSEQTVARPAIERAAPKINSVTGALEDVGCSLERLRALFGETNGEIHDLTVNAPDFIRDQPKVFERRLYDAWLLLLIVGEQLTDLDSIVSAITEKAYDDRRAVAA